MRHISWLCDHNGRPFHHSLCTLTKALARLRSGLLCRPFLVVSILGTIRQRWPAVTDGICSLEPQRTRLSGLGQPRAAATAYDRECSGSTLGTLERCQRPVPVRSSDLLLVPDAPSAGGEDTVIWSVMRTHTRSRNTCNVNLVGTQST